MALYINNFRGRAGRVEQSKHLRAEFDAIEDAFTRLQALNIAAYLSIYVNSTSLSGIVTVSPDNGFLQELTLTADAAIQVAPPLNEGQYRMSLLIHGSKYKVTNLWGAQTWKEYGLDNWWYLYCGLGPYASMLLDFFWDRCSHTWICVASSRNLFTTLVGGVEERFYPLLDNLSNIEGDDTLGFTRATSGMIWDYNQAYHYLRDEEPRFAGIRYIDNWVADPSDLTGIGWVATDTTVATDAGAGPTGGDVSRLTFTATGAKVACYILPSFGRAGINSDPIKVAVSFKGKAISGTEDVRIYCAFMGKTNATVPVHDVTQRELDGEWRTYGAVLDVAKDGNSNAALALNQEYPRTLMEIAFAAPSGSLGGDIQITDVQVEVLRGTDAETYSEIQGGTIGSSLVLAGSGTGLWVDGTKTLTLASVGQYVDFGANLEIGRSYLVHPRLTDGEPADIRMQNEVTVWAAGMPSDELYLQEAPFVFQYDGGQLKFVLIEGTSAVYDLDIYALTDQHGLSGYENSDADPAVPLSSGILDGLAREVTSENVIPFNFFRTFSSWDKTGLSGVAAADCANPVFQSEYGLDQWPARATLLQGASLFTEGFIQRAFVIPPTTDAHDFTMWIRRTLDVEGNQIVTPQHDDVTVPLSRYVDFEAELTGSGANIESGRIRLDIQNATFVGATSSDHYRLGIFLWKDWYQVVIQLDNDGAHDGFRVRVYPASGLTPDPSDIDVTVQGWCIIDWAQFEVTGGTYIGSSPIVGGEIRATEEMTSALPDGEYYRTENQLNAGDAGHIAMLRTNDVLWDDEDGVYRNVLYTTELLLADPTSRNMHEFGLVEQEDVPLINLTLATTTLFPIEVLDSFQLGCDITYGELKIVPEEAHDESGDLLSIDMEQILISYGPDELEHDETGDILSVVMTQILISYGPDELEHDESGDLLSVVMESKLVTVDTPDEELQLGCDIRPAGCSLTPI